MSNRHYDEFCKADIPDLTPLDRQLLGHYCARFNEDVRPPRAWPPLYELKLITGAHEKSISRSLGRLRKRNLLVRITLASKDRGVKAEYAINLPVQTSHKVTEELPNTSDFIDVEVTEQVAISNPTALESNSSVTAKSPSGYPKRIKPIKPKTENIARFSSILEGVPKELRSRVQPGNNLETRLDKLATLNVTDEAIRATLNGNSWQGVTTPGAKVERVLDELIAVTEASLVQVGQDRLDQEQWREELAEASNNASSNPTHWAQLARQQMKGDQG